MFQWECVDENSKRAKDAIYRKDRGEIPSKMSNATRKICALSFAYSSALVNRPKKEMEQRKKLTVKVVACAVYLAVNVFRANI